MLENAVKKKICAQKSEEQTKKEGKKWVRKDCSLVWYGMTKPLQNKLFIIF